MRFLKNKNFVDILILLIVTAIICLPMLSEYLNIYTDDGIQHIARAYGTYEAIKSGNFMGNVIHKFANGFGYSWNLFYGASTVFGILFFKILTGSYIIGYKLFCFICLLFSGITMYWFVKKLSKNSNVAILAGSLYIIAPYHLTDLYVRNALGEFVSFAFIPLVFLGLYNLFKQEKGDWVLTIGAIGVLFTHNISCLYVSIFAFIYVAINFKKLKNKIILKKLCFNILFICVIGCCYLLPLLETRMTVKYTVYEDDFMATIDSIQEQRLSISRLFATGTGESFVFELGIYMIIMLAFSVMALGSLRDVYKKDYIFFLVCGIVSMLMATKLFPWNIMPKFLRIIQFPWRYLQFTSFFFAIIASINMGTVIKKYSLKDSLIIIVISLIYIIALKGYVKYSNNLPKEVAEYNLGTISGQENECIAGMGKGEYLPKKAYYNSFYLATREDRIYALEGRAVVSNEEKNGGQYSAKVVTFEENTILELPYIFYPGYEITCDGMHVMAIETKNGMLGVKIPKNESALLEVKYSGTEIMKISLLLSIVGSIGLVIYIIINRKGKNHEASCGDSWKA